MSKQHKNQKNNPLPSTPLDAPQPLTSKDKEPIQAAPPTKVAAAPFQLPPYTQYIVLGILALVYILIRKNFFEIPMERDEGIYAYFGRLVLDGAVPYRDFYEHRLPGIFYMYAVLVGIFGEFEGLALGITMLNIGTLTFTYFFARRFFGSQPVAIAATIFSAVLALAPEISGFTRQSEHIVMIWAMGGLHFLLKGMEEDKWKYLLWSGVFMCLAMLTKPNGVFFILLGGFWLVAYYLLERREGIEASFFDKFKRTVAKAGIYSAGVFGIFGVICLLMLMQGVLGDMFYWSVTYSAGYVSRIDMSEGFAKYFMPTFKGVTANYMLFWIMALIGTIAYIALPSKEANSTAKKIALPLFIFCSFLTITPSYTFYGHYWIMFVPSIAFAAAAALHCLHSLMGKTMMAGIVVSAAVAVSLGFHSSSISADKTLGGSYYFSPKADKIVMKTYGGNPFNEAFQIGKFLKKRMSPSDKLAMIGSEPQLFIYTGANSVTRHAYFSYLMQDSMTTDVMRFQEEYRKDIETGKPKYIVFFNHDISILANPNANFTMINELLTVYIPKHYRIVGVVDLVGTGQPRYVLDEQQAPLYQFAKSADPKQRIWTILVYERLPEPVNQ